MDQCGDQHRLTEQVVQSTLEPLRSRRWVAASTQAEQSFRSMEKPQHPASMGPDGILEGTELCRQ